MTAAQSRHRLLQGSDSRIGAVVLAGGLARRMGGQDKGLIDLAGQPMAQYVLRTIAESVDQIIVNANRHIDRYEALAQPFAAEVVPDKLSGHLGPLAGLSAALESLATDFVFMCPCDSPFLQAQLLDDLLEACLRDDADIAVPHDGQRLQPVFCVVHRRVKPMLDDFLASGERKIDRWFEQHHICQVAACNYADSFRNINTEQERLIAEKELGHD